jgi:hypothetical protein
LIVAATIVSDYSSLFVVRRWLTLTAQKPIAALLVAPLIGGLVVLIIYAIAFCLHFALWTNGTVFPLFLYQWLNGEFAAASAYVTAAVRLFLLVAVIYGSFMIPTAMVYAWLPMMFFGIIGVRLFHMLTRVVSGAQWFIREGNARPFRAIGLVAAVLVFALAASVQLLK